MQETKQQRKGARRPMIPVIRITNPFNPREFVREEMAWTRRKTLDAYFPAVEAAPVVVSINGRIVPGEQFGMTYLDKTDNVVVCPVPTGGGGGKQILGMVAMIAVAVAAPMLAGAMNGVMGLTTVAGSALTSTGMMLTAGFSMAGSLLVSSIFAPPQPTASSTSTSTSYGVDGAKNTSLEGIPVPVNYGAYRMGGNILGMYVDNVADDDQVLYMLLSAGEGPIASISDIELNDTPLADFGSNVEVQTRLGLPNQAVIPWFSRVIVPQSASARLSTEWTYHTTTTAVDMLRLDFAAPSGLFKADIKSGKTNTHSVPLEAQYRPADGSSDWVPFAAADTVAGYRDVIGLRGDGATVWKDAHGKQITDEATLLYLDNNSGTTTIDPFGMDFTVRTPVYAGEMAITAGKRSAVRRSFTSAQLPSRKYEVRVRRSTEDSTEDTVVDDVYLTDVNEIVVQEMTYPNTALLALKITLGSQISGAPSVNFTHGGRLIQVYGARTEGAAPGWYSAASTNPAWITWDMLTHKRYGGAMPAARLDFPAFQAWADYCDSEGYAWNGPIDSEMNVWDAAQLVLRVGHSQLVNVGTRYTVVTERPGNPVMMFSVANMIEGSYKETWLGTQDRANEIDVTYFDKTDKFKQRTVKIYDPAALTAGAKQRTSAITLYGVTDHETAYKEGQFQLNLNRYILRTVEFSAPLEAVACSVGDLIYVQHDMTQWGQAGRFEAGSTRSAMQLDRPVRMAAGRQYKLLATFDAIQRASGSVLSVVGTSVFLSGFGGDRPVKRLQVNGRDLRVAGTFDHGGGYGVILDDTTGIAPGQAYTLWDTDVIEEANVVNDPGEHAAITLQSPMTSAPAQFTNWMFGEVDKVKQTFRVKAVAGTHEYKRDITAIEYKEEVYDFSRYGLNVPALPAAAGVIGPVRNLSLYEETYVAGGAIVTSVVASWSAPAVGNYAGADVYVSRNDGPPVKLADARNVTSAVIEAAKGDVLTVQVQAYDIWGKRSPFDAAPLASYTVVGEVAGIEVGGVTGVGYTWSGRDCKINWRYNSTTHAYEFGSEPTGADAGALDPHFKDYEIRVYEKNGTTLRRVEYTTDNSYVYIYDKNFADGAARDLVFEIRMRDIFNNLGAPATLEAYNPPPTVTNTACTATFESATIAYEHSGDPDFAGAQVFVSESALDLDDTGSAAARACLVYEGPDSSILVPGLMFNQTYYYRVVPFDAFGKTGLIPSAVLSFKTSYFNVDTIRNEMLEVGKFARTIDPVGIVDTLPDPATWERPLVVFLTTEAKMYRLENGKWTSSVPSADVTGQLVAEQIADAAIGTAKFAQGISPVGVVDVMPAVPGYDGPSVVMLKTDGKLYRLLDGQWTAAVPAVDITGQLSNEQLQDIAAAKIAGQLTDAQIKEISAAKIAGQLTNDQLQDIAAAKIAGQLTSDQIRDIAAAKLTGTVTAAQIADAAISTAKFAQGIQPVSVVNALPAVPGYAGPSVVFLTTDGKLYRLAGGSWTAAVPATDLTGQIAQTQIRDDAISTAKIAAGAITTAKLAAGSVTANEIAAETITAGKIAAGAITSDELSAGAVTTVKLAASAVTANEIAAGAVTTAKLTAGAVSANTIAASAITTDKIDANAITTAKIAAGAVTADTIAVNAITALKIDAGAVTTAKLAVGAVTADTIASNAITSIKIDARAITAGKIAANAVTANEIAASAITATKIDAGAVTTSKLAAGAVTAKEIAVNAITAGKIAAGAVSAGELAAGAVTTPKLAVGAVTANEIGAYAITVGKIAVGAVTTDTIAVNAITAGKIAAGAISATEIAANAITSDKLATGQLLTTSAQIGDGIIVSAKIGNAQVNTFKIGANAVTVPAFVNGSGSAKAVRPGQEVYIGSVTATYTDAVDLAILANWQTSTSGNTNSGVRVKVGTTTLLEWSDSCFGGYTESHSASTKSRLGAGTYTFNVYVFNDWTSGQFDIWNWSCLLLGVMR